MFAKSFLFFMGVYLVLGHPHSCEKTQPENIKHIALQKQIGKDHDTLKAFARSLFFHKDSEVIHLLFKGFFGAYQLTPRPHKGILLLDQEKRVFGAYSLDMDDNGKELIGNLYSGIPFDDNRWSTHKILTLYRVDPDHPMGRRCTEIAFPVKTENQLLGWVLFQMDMDILREHYDTQEETLRRLKF
jgi:hypothetical protein